MQSYSKQKYFLLGYNTPLSSSPFFLLFFSSFFHGLTVFFFNRHPSLARFVLSLSAVPLPVSLMPDPPTSSFLPTPVHPTPLLLANAATLEHNWSMPKLRQAWVFHTVEFLQRRNHPQQCRNTMGMRQSVRQLRLGKCHIFHALWPR